MSAFVQINLGFHEARQRGDISGGAYSLGLYLACEANFFTRRVTTTLVRIVDDLEAACTTRTMLRRLNELREHGFIEFESHPGQRRGYPIQVTGKLVYGTRPRHDLDTEDPFRDEVTSTATSTREPAESAATPDGNTESRSLEPRHAPRHARGLQEREEIDLELLNQKPSRGKAEAAKARVTHGNGGGPGWIENLNSYTGCRYVRGTHAMSAKYDPLGKDKPPSDWSYERPTREEIGAALVDRESVQQEVSS